MMNHDAKDIKLSQILDVIDDEELISIVNYESPIYEAMYYTGEAGKINPDSKFKDMLLVNVAAIDDYLLILVKEQPNVESES